MPDKYDIAHALSDLFRANSDADSTEGTRRMRDFHKQQNEAVAEGWSRPASRRYWEIDDLRKADNAKLESQRGYMGALESLLLDSIYGAGNALDSASKAIKNTQYVPDRVYDVINGAKRAVR